mgnify:CR=1 FL=1
MIENVQHIDDDISDIAKKYLEQKYDDEDEELPIENTTKVNELHFNSDNNVNENSLIKEFQQKAK